MLPYTILVVTRNNPVALSALLGSILAQIPPTGTVPQLAIGDGSDRPIIYDPSMSRLLAMFPLVYGHFKTPEVNHQRRSMLQRLDRQYHHVLCLDDDLILCPDYLKAVEFTCDTIAGKPIAVSGVTVDTSNEKGYPDYSILTRDRGNSHAFNDEGTLLDFADVMYSEAVAHFGATVGHMVTTVQGFLDALDKFSKLSDSPSLVDDAAAVSLSRFPEYPNLNRGMRAWHTGNSNKWWNPWGHKRAAVDSLVEKGKA